MMRTLRLLILAVVASSIVAAMLPEQSTALSGSEFKAGRIIDNNVFFSGGDLSASTIQSFLDAKVPNCDTNGTQTLYDPANGDTVTRAVYSSRRGVSAPFTCLRNFSQSTPSKTAESGLCNAYNGGTKSAAQIIYDVSVACNVSARAMIVLLQKEQSLITDDWPWPIQYRSATGYGCPDTAPCDAEYYGFFNQVYSAARQFKRYDRDASLFNYRANTNTYVLYNPNASCGGSTIFIENSATAGLYNYTPYQPNAAALANLYGTGDGCSAYGNRNFWRMFNDWFGNTIGPDYSWSIESYTYSGGDATIAQGQTETITLRARNTGRLPWYNHGDHPIRLGTWEPAGRASSLFGTTRLANMTENVVQPNSVGTFTFTVTPQNLGTYVEGLNLVAENYQWLQWAGLRPTIQVTPPYQWQIQSINYEKGTGYMDPGSKQLVTVIARNTGTTTWQKLGPNPVRLGTWQPSRQSSVSQTWPSPIRAAEMNEMTVAPGQNAGFQFYVTMPSSGYFYERFNLVAEGLTWLNDTGMILYLEGKSFSWAPVWHTHSTGTANIARNTDFTVTLKARNTGTMTWSKTNYPVRVATTAPQNRGSAFYTPSWINDIRPTVLVEESVAPGQEGTFIIPMRTPATPGVRIERFNLIAEGILWFNDPNFSVYINVL